jgi:CRISPR system Cascade subunit CasD
MNTLLLRLAAPLQSWGAQSKFNRRTTEREPTKSGVIGMIAAALGRRRTEDLSDLLALRFGARLDQPGTLLRDFHTAHTPDGKEAFISDRHYLADAVFLVGLEGEADKLRAIEAALLRPAFPLYLGRRSCPPAGRLVVGMRALPLEEALRREPWQAADWYKARRASAPPDLLIRDARPGEGAAITALDNPVSYNQQHRKYAFRATMHDPFVGMEDT